MFDYFGKRCAFFKIFDKHIPFFKIVVNMPRSFFKIAHNPFFKVSGFPKGCRMRKSSGFVQRSRHPEGLGAKTHQEFRRGAGAAKPTGRSLSASGAGKPDFRSDIR